MKTLLKVVAVGLGLLILLIVGLVILGFSQIDALAKRGIEEGGTYVLGVETTVDGADVGIFDGTFAMSGLTVGNPAGFSTPHFLALPAANVQVDTKSIQSETIVVPTLNIGKADLYIDRADGETNYQAILDNVGRFEKGEKTEPAGEGATFVVNSLVLQGANVKVTGFGPVSDVVGDLTVDLPKVELQNVGSEEPLTAGELISLIVKTLLSTTVEAAGGKLPEQLIGDLKSRLGSLESLKDLGITAVGDVGALAEGIAGDAAKQLENITDGAAGKVDDVKEQAEEAVDNVKQEAEKAVDDAKNTIKGLIPGQKKGDD